MGEGWGGSDMKIFKKFFFILTRNHGFTQAVAVNIVIRPLKIYTVSLNWILVAVIYAKSNALYVTEHYSIHTNT